MRHQKWKSSIRDGNACRSVFLGLRKKLPLFIVAGIAFYVITALDRAKTSYDIKHDNGSAGPITIDETLLGDQSVHKLHRSDLHTAGQEKCPEEWLKSPALLKYRKFATQRTLLDALADTASSQYGRELTDFDARQRDRKDQLAKIREAQSGHKTDTKEWREKEEEANQIKRVDADAGNREDFRVKALANLQTQYSIIYNDFGPALPDTVSRVQQRSTVFIDKLLWPLMDEGKSVHIVFQVFRTTALIIIILTFIFIFVLAIQLLPFADGTGTTSDQLKSLISLKSIKAKGEVVKTAIIGVTAVGVGTAVVVGARAVDTSRKTAEPAASVMSAGPFALRWPNGFIGQSNINAAYYRDLALFSELLFERITREQITREHQTTLLKPNIQVPAPVVISRTVVDSRGINLILDELKNIVTKLPATTDVSSISKSIDSLKVTLQTANRPVDCNCQAALTSIKDSLDRMGKAIGTPPGPVTSTSSSVTSSVASASPDNATLISNLAAAVQSINKIEADIKAALDADRLRDRPDGRNVLNRTDDFIFGAEYYAISQLAYDELIKSFPALTPVFARMKMLPPQRKSDFRKALHNEIKVQNLTKFLSKVGEARILERAKLPK